jgi:thioesterase domain-containing protein/acyl carrier protein
MLIDLVTACFERVLKSDGIGPDDNFFDLGGDSLMALSLIAEIEKATQRELPLTAIYDAATINELVAILQNEAVPRFNPVVLIQQGSDAPPVFLIHSIFGNVVELIGLGRTMPTARTVYGIAARGLDGLEPPNDRVEAMAECYAEAIAEMQPHGPYLLTGYSFGGLVALEIAQILRARGEEVAFLGFIDSYPVARSWPLPCRIQVRGQQIRHGARCFLQRMRTDLAGALRLAWLRLTTQRAGVRTAAALDAVGDVALPNAVRRVREAGYRALMHHRPRPYAGRVVFFCAEVPIDYPRAPFAVWGRFIEEIEVRRIPGDHVSMLRSHTVDLAQVLGREIERAMRERAVPRSAEAA